MRAYAAMAAGRHGLAGKLAAWLSCFSPFWGCLTDSQGLGHQPFWQVETMASRMAFVPQVDIPKVLLRKDGRFKPLHEMLIQYTAQDWGRFAIG